MISLLVAFLLLLFSALQTVYTIVGYYDSFGNHTPGERNHTLGELNYTLREINHTLGELNQALGKN